jgi:hypothetical protein
MAEEQSRTWTETIQLEGGQLLDKVREVIHQGNVRRITIKQDDRVIVALPLTLGVVTAVVAPMLAAVGAIAALATNCSIEIVREEKGGVAGAEDEDQPQG